ncbi:oleoyl-acyl carrier protein thioesterase, chloroplastic-like isoform X2 [Asparagus officinalis]|uniref:oleoyl-acyl carrier protein thioesterase, chloroplastic-like isoform X2 n=1 Tax=Asparagus officinalis TaxID=4686 RepID=UPI00098E0392|nr:oleoyl-acyl carrier protein thioesterase, chloroplastic-like isoform X2 [Asparagus officinalis]
MRKLGLIWVTSRMHIEMYKYPAWGDVVEIETWCQGEGKIGIRRDWILKDLATGSVIGRATRQTLPLDWMGGQQSDGFIVRKFVMMNQDTRKLQRVTDEVREEYLVFCPRTPRFAFTEEDDNSLKKIPKLQDPAQHSRFGLASVPQDIIGTYELQTITLDYKKECQHDDVVDSLTSLQLLDDEKELLPRDGSKGSAIRKQEDQDGRRFLHFLRSSNNGVEINRGCTEWRKLSR